MMSPGQTLETTKTPLLTVKVVLLVPLTAVASSTLMNAPTRPLVPSVTLPLTVNDWNTPVKLMLTALGPNVTVRITGENVKHGSEATTS